MSLTVVYAIINTVNDKYYIGQAYLKDKRWKNHKIALRNGKHHSRHLQSAYDLYGASSFIYVVLETVSDVSLLTIREQYWMDFYNSANREYGYNISPSAGSPLGVKHTQETKDNWSRQRKGQKRSAEFAASVSAMMKGKIVSQETKDKLSAAHIGKSHHTEEHKIALAERMKGNSWNKGRKHTPEETERRRKSITGKKRSPEQRARMAEAQRKRFAVKEDLTRI